MVVRLARDVMGWKEVYDPTLSGTGMYIVDCAGLVLAAWQRGGFWDWNPLLCDSHAMMVLDKLFSDGCYWTLSCDSEGVHCRIVSPSGFVIDGTDVTGDRKRCICLTALQTVGRQ